MDVYALRDPRTNEVRYIGIARDIYRRFAQHLLKVEGNPQKDAWIAELKDLGLAPILKRLESNVDALLIRERERYWIQFYLNQGARLLNIQHGPISSTPVESDYCTASDAAQILSEKLGRPILCNYISKMSKSKRHSIRVVKFDRIWMYHRSDIADCTIKQKRRA